MINVTSAFKIAAQAPVKAAKASISITGGSTISSSDDLVSINIESSGNILSCATKCCITKILGTSRDLSGKTFSVTLELQSGNNWESCLLGVFIVQEQTYDFEKNLTNIKAYDQIGIMGLTKYSENQLTYNTAVSNLASQIATKFGIGGNIDATAPNMSHVVATDLYKNINGTTYRDILSEIAGATVTLAKITGNNLVISTPDFNGSNLETLTYANLKKLTFENKYGPVNSVVLARTPQEDNVVATDDESVTTNGLTEIKIANNEILDDNRETMITPILNKIDGFEFYPFEATTEGHGWYEVGDFLNISDGTTTKKIMITSISLTIDGGIKEILKGVALTETQTNYALAGGITKTIYNTEIQVDKQNQQIRSIVSEQAALENTVNENYTEITQNISNVITSVQNSGGNNLLKNSAMYSLDGDQNPISWTLSGSGTISIAPSAEAAVNGSLSRQNITLNNLTASQTVEVKADSSTVTDKTYYSFSCKIKKTAVGSCLVRITDGTEAGVWEISLANGKTSFYDDHSIEAMLPKSSNLTVSVFGSSDSEFSITDMMLAVGNYKTQWTQANGEFANTQVTIDSNGVIIRSSTLSGTYTKQTPQELSAYSNNTLSATINNDGISAPKAEFKNEIAMSPIKIVPQSDGWAFVKDED